MSQIALLVAMSATTGLFGGRTASVSCRGGSCQQPQAYYSNYQPQYYQPAAYPAGHAAQTNYTSYYYPPANAAPAPYYYPGSYARAGTSCATGTCSR